MPGSPSIWVLATLLGGFLALLKLLDITTDETEAPFWAYALGLAVGVTVVLLW